MRHVHVFEYLLCDAGKSGRGHLAALVQSDGRVKNYRDDDLRIVDRSEPSEGPDVFRFRICASLWVDFLRRARFSCRGVAFESRLAAGTFEYDLLHHRAHFCGSVRRNHALAFSRMERYVLKGPLRRSAA